MPGESTLPQILAYKEFLAYYPITKLYEVTFSRLNSFPKLQAALGFDPDHVWSEDERRNFRSSFYYFDRAYQTLCDSTVTTTAADALLEWLKVYPFERIKIMSNQELLRSLESMWPSIKAIGQQNIIEVSTQTSIGDDRPFKNRRAFSMMRSYLNIAYIHELTPENSNWVRAHDIGSRYMENALGDYVIVQRYFGVGTGDDAERAMEIAIKNGAEIVFATTASLITACRRVAARHPETQILNCSVNMPYADVRTYYSRIYEGKFISGAIVGAISKKENIGYIASYPIFGVTAGINAFALGVQLTNPSAKVHLKWACVGDDPVRELVDQNIEFISTLDVPLSGWSEGEWGTLRMHEDGTSEMIASPYWDWGNFYLQIAQSILCGEWDTSGKTVARAVNYWWGIASGVVGLDFSDKLPEGVKMLANILKEGIKNGTVDPFLRKIVSQDGVIRNDGSRVLTPEEMLQMDWLCENVIGTIPEFESLSEKAKVITRLQGIYRDRIPPKKERGIM